MNMKSTKILVRIICFLLILMGGIGNVQAHAGLVDSSPKDGELLHHNPGQLSFAFTEVLEADLVEIHLYDWNGEQVMLERPKLQPGDATRVHVSLPPDMAEGTYTAIVSVVSEDGHPVEERLIFSLGQKSAHVAEPSQKQADPTYLILLRFLTQSILLVGGGLYLVACLAQRYGLPSFAQSLGRGRPIGWLLMFIGLTSLWFVYDASLPAASLTTALWQGNVSVLSQSPFAIMLLVSALLLLLLGLPGMITGWYVAVWLLLIVTQAFGGHAWGLSPLWLALLLRVLHVLSIALWLGALAYLFLHKSQAQRGNEAFKRFFLRLVAMAALVSLLTGILMLWVQTDLAKMLESWMIWNDLLVVKLVLVLSMLIVAYRQRNGWLGKHVLNEKRLRWEVVFGILAIFAGLWMSQMPYPG